MKLRSPYHSTPGRRPRSLTEMRVESAAPPRAVSMCGTEGWLEVLAEREGATDGWRRRYVRLQQGRLFCYVGTSRADLPATPPKGSAAVVVELRSATCDADGLLIGVRCAATNTLYKLRASSLVEAKFWAQDLKDSCAHAEGQEDGDSTRRLESSPVVPTPERISRRRAFLALEGARVLGVDAPGTVMKGQIHKPPASPMTSDSSIGAATSPVYADAMRTVSSNGSFPVVSVCASLAAGQEHVAAQLDARQTRAQSGVCRAQRRAQRVALLGLVKQPEPHHRHMRYAF